MEQNYVVRYKIEPRWLYLKDYQARNDGEGYTLRSTEDRAEASKLSKKEAEKALKALSPLEPKMIEA